jgi:glycosyltransferase involved in cell wall biosynthesis
MGNGWIDAREVAMNRVDVTLVGQPKTYDGMGTHFVSFAELIEGHAKMSGRYFYDLEPLLPDSVLRVLKDHQGVGRVALLLDMLWAPYSHYAGARKMPKDSEVKLAFSVFESSQIPPEWVEILNRDFDALVVPDPFCEEIHRNSGVTLPIFLVPLPLKLEHFRRKPAKKRGKGPFVFGNLNRLMERKDQATLVRAFRSAFGEDEGVKLLLFCRSEEEYYGREVRELVKGMGNVLLQVERLADKESFFDAIDAYVSISKGEGYSITPREAMSLGIPCVISNGTAQKTLVESGYVRSVEPTRLERAWVDPFHFFYGHWKVCEEEAVKEALLDLYRNYEQYWQKAQEGRSWVMQYGYEALRQKVRMLVKPGKVVLGKENRVTDEGIETDSARLYEAFAVSLGQAADRLFQGGESGGIEG